MVTTALLCGACATGTDGRSATASAAASALPAPTTSARALPEAAARAQAASVAARFQQELGAKLQSAMVAGGPAAAIEVCQAAAPAIAARVSHESGWDVRRVGTRVRNPASGRPDAWERAQLSAFAERIAAGESAETIDAYAVVDDGGVATERYMKAIVTAPACLACHGDPAAQSAEVRAQLGARYPDDRATGYRAGDLRGAFTLRRPPATGR
jgi:hypothetical protein